MTIYVAVLHQNSWIVENMLYMDSYSGKKMKLSAKYGMLAFDVEHFVPS